MASEEEQRAKFDQATAILKSINPSGGLSSSEANALLNAIVGVLSDTYTTPQTGKSDEQLKTDYAPAWQEYTQYPPDSVVRGILNDVQTGYGPLEIKNRVKAFFVKIRKKEIDPATGQPYTANSLESDYTTEVDRLYGQWQQYQQKLRERSQSQIENDVFLKEGLSSADARYNPEEFFQSQFSALDRDYANTQKSAGNAAAIKSKKSNSPSASTRERTSSSPSTPAVAGVPTPRVGASPTNTPEKKAMIEQQMLQLLAQKLVDAGRTPLKDELAQRSIFIEAANIPEKTKVAKKVPKYKVVGTEIVPVK
jgi:hypothetical protein